MTTTRRTDVPMELLQFRFSHFNEKVRWALDYKSVPHTRTSLLPGPHMRRVKRLTGQTSTPVLRIGEHYLKGSADILTDLEHHFPDPPLLPHERDAKVLAHELQSHFDRQLGPAVRILLFDTLLDCGRYLPDMFSLGQRASVRLAYRTVFPLVKPAIRSANGVTGPAAVRRAEATVHRNLDEIEALARPTGYLAGAAFSIADLTAAALLAPLLDLKHPDMRHPQPRPPAFEALVASWAEHPASVWARGIYDRHRAEGPAEMAEPVSQTAP